MKMDGFLYTSQGGRKYNEDSVSFRCEGDTGIFVAADGLGGHDNGALASSCVVDTLLEAWNAKSQAGEERRQWLLLQIEQANQKLLTLQKEANSRMRSTVSALLIDGGQAVWGHVGDSRLYYCHDSGICRVTEDHSVAYKKYKAGEITKQQIGQDEDQPSLLRALGNPDRNEPDLDGAALENGDAFLLCTDGVWEYLDDEEILIDLLKAETAQEWAELLLLRVIARVRPDHDNLSLITVLIE